MRGGKAEQAGGGVIRVGERREEEGERGKLPGGASLSAAATGEGSGARVWDGACAGKRVKENGLGRRKGLGPAVWWKGRRAGAGWGQAGVSRSQELDRLGGLDV